MKPKLVVAMVGPPACGKSHVAQKLKESLNDFGLKTAVFNNGEIRRKLHPDSAQDAAFFNPDDQDARAKRDEIALINLYAAKDFLESGGDVAVLDATNTTKSRRAKIAGHLFHLPKLFVECRLEDEALARVFIAGKARLPEFRNMTETHAATVFAERIAFYRRDFEPLGEESDYIVLESVSRQILAERRGQTPYFPIIRDALVADGIKKLCLVRHGQTPFNRQGRIGGDPPLTAVGREQAHALAKSLAVENVPILFTSTRKRSRETAEIIAAEITDAQIIPLTEFDELDAGECEGMLYEVFRWSRPEAAAKRNQDKFRFAWPGGGESYADAQERVVRGLNKALYLAGPANGFSIVGHQAVNRLLLSHFLFRRTEDVPHTPIPQNAYFRIESTQRRKLCELVEFAPEP